jgi:adenylate cyclase
MTGAALLIGLTPATDSAELRTVDWRFEVRGTQPPPDDVVMVLIDATTFRELQVPWPLDRRMHAKVIDWLDDAGAMAIAYDVQFTEPSHSDGWEATAEDRALFAAVRRSRGRTVLTTGELGKRGETLIFGGDAEVQAVGARVSQALFPLDSDGTIRRVRRAVRGVPSLSVVATEIARRRPVPRSEFDRDGTAWIDFAGPPGSIRKVSFSTVYQGRADPAMFRGAVVVVGALSGAVQDARRTTTSPDGQMSGAEIHASAIATLLDDTPLHRTPGWVTMALTVLLGLLAPLATICFGLIAVGIVVVVALAYVGLVQLAFQMGLIIPALDPLIALTLSSAGVFAVQFAWMAAERNAAREAIGLFAPPHVVGEVLNFLTRGEDLRRLTKSEETTCLFCDLRGFTNYCETPDEARVHRVLNQYLSEMSAAIYSEGGTIVGYRGDGIVAYFGAVEDMDHHADRAVRAAREMAGPRLRGLNRWMAAEDLGDGFDMGIGVYSGTILSGITGSDRRLEYTAVGDAANVASRLEDETKHHAQQVLISGTTVAILQKEKPSLVYLDTIQIRNRSVPVSIYGLNGSTVA